MNDLQKKKHELDPKASENLSRYLLEENGKMLDRLSELDKRLTNTNFLTNGGGAVALLTYFGSHGAPLALKVALGLFSLGVIATGVEIRALLTYFGHVFNDCSKKNRDFNSGLITAIELATIPTEVGRTSQVVNHVAGLISQLLFVAGVVLSAYSFLCNS